MGRTAMSANHAINHCPNEELAVGWTLHSLTTNEENLMAEHVPTCSICQEIVSSTREVTALVGGSVVQEEPPAYLKERIMALAINQVPPVKEIDTIEKAAKSKDKVQETISLDQIRNRPRILLIAATVIIVALAMLSGVLGLRLSQLTNQQSVQATQQSKVFDVLGDPALHRTFLRTNNGVTAAILLSSTKGAAVLPLGLNPNNTKDQTYVLWAIGNGAPVPLSTFDVASAEQTPQLGTLPSSAATSSGFAVSLEPGRSMPTSPTDVIASGQVTS